MFSTSRTKNKELIITQLYEIFRYDKELIVSVCEAQNWQIDECIENLVSYGENLDITNETKENNNNTNNNNYATAVKDDNKNNDQNVIQDLNESKFNNLGAVPKNNINFEPSFNGSFLNDRQIKNVADHIVSGHKIMLLMRGPPGCGKSYLARQLVTFVDPTGKNYNRSFICSTDDYFYDINDRYVYQAEKLSDAHEFNQKKVRKKAMEGWSPLIIDNTNIKIWEMLPYVQIAIQYGYLIELLEPHTPWRNSASKLALKNHHGVSKEKIKRTLMNFEPVTRNQLLQMMKNTQYTCPLPQIRRYPPIEIQNLNMEIGSPERKTSVNDQNRQTEKEPTCESLNSKRSWSNYNNQSTMNQEENEIGAETSETLINNLDSSSTKLNSWETYNDNVKEKESNINPIRNEDDNSSSSFTVYNSTNQTMISNLKTAENDLICFEQENTETFDNSSNSWTTYDDQPKPPRNENQENKTNVIENMNQNESVPIKTISEESWQPYERESNEFWNVQKTATNTLFLPKPQRNVPKTDISPNENIFKLLKENEESTKNTDPSKETINSKDILKRHSIDCPNENESFKLVRQICPDKNINGLWDLFEKCNGNAQWVLDILLRDDTYVESINRTSKILDYECNCNNDPDVVLIKDSSEQHSKNDSTTDLSKHKRNKDKFFVTDELLKVKHTIENRVVMDDSQFSEHVRKVRNTKHGIENSVNCLMQTPICSENQLEENGSDDLVETANENEMIEMNLGNEFIQQLENLFGARPSINLKTLKTNIFMPKALGKQLYALWMESIYNQLEEEKQEIIKRDEEFAVLLQSSSEANTANQESYKDILDMELAWSVYKSNPDQWKDATPQNLAAHLAHSKLCEIFPDIEKDTLLQILQAHENSLSQTVKALNSSIEEGCSDIMKETRNNLMKLAHDESEDKLTEETLEKNLVKKLSPEESKKSALRDFEECRNLAAHHSQLKAECYEKAKEAIQKGNSAVAVYYSQISNLHKNKIDFYNHKAASCIMEVHDLTQNNPDFIDLHYLHTMEALECLDIFLDNHILKLRNMNRPYKHIFIITGRGLHSAKGVSTIKNKVKSRLKDRTLKWSEVNPGLLKVKVFSGSKFSKNS